MKEEFDNVYWLGPEVAAVEIDPDYVDLLPQNDPVPLVPIFVFWGDQVEGLFTIKATVELRNPSGTIIASQVRTERDVCIGSASDF
jgi:hypothetical protein